MMYGPYIIAFMGRTTALHLCYKGWYLIGLYGTLTAIKFIYTFIQLCGLYLLLKATKMSTKTSEAIIEVNIHLLIQILFLGRDGLYIIKFMLEGSCSFIRDETFEFVPLEIFLCRFVSILAVNLFRSELLAAKAAAEEIPMAIPEIRDI
ncbi:unnamed protein product [Orchesella dallaii]|uniref:Protein RFT1 homolog n=1 Tax=Orchesella dallaii TaxID=48710 RepID=A0ABP1RUF7_9HEXA